MEQDRYALPLVGIVALCTLPHVPYLSPWVIGACLFIWLYTVIAARASWRPLPRPVIIILAGVFFVAAMTTHEGFTIEAFIALLALMAGLKVLETRSQRDRMVAVILCYFLIVAGMFFSDSIWSTTYKILAVATTTGVLIYINFPGRTRTGAFKVSWALIVQAVPLTIILFLFFPRVQGGLWGRTHLNFAQTGFNDEMSFGSIARLAQNTAIAFRVEFDGEIPPQHDLYWRGVVLWSFDGLEWERNMDRRSQAPDLVDAAQPVRYIVTLEPHNEHWLFTLDMPTDIDLRWSRILYDYVGYRWRPITSRVSYAARSFLQAKTPLHKYYEERALQLPSGGNQRARELAASLAAQSGNDAEYVRKVLDYYRQQPFYYTLTPPQLSRNTGELVDRRNLDLVDRFLFESRRGFCEHFAGSFTYLMRAGGVPARVVLGYQGGSLNEYGNYLVVRQSNAHAWSEVWLEGRGWVRVDPTGVVAPERLSGAAGGDLVAGEADSFLSLRNLALFGGLLNDLGKRFDYYNNLWNKWVMTYSANEQVGFFGSLGIRVADSQGLARAVLVFLVVSGIVIVLVNLYLYRRKRKPGSDIADTWSEFCRKLARIGLPRSPEQGPLAYLKYITKHRPELAEQASSIVSCYVRLRYGRKRRAETAADLRALVKKFVPKKKG